MDAQTDRQTDRRMVRIIIEGPIISHHGIAAQRQTFMEDYAATRCDANKAKNSPQSYIIHRIRPTVIAGVLYCEVNAYDK